MTNYPPGTSRRDLVRGGIIDPDVECPECGAIVNSGESHTEWCDCDDMTDDEIREFWAEERNHVEYDPVEHNK